MLLKVWIYSQLGNSCGGKFAGKTFAMKIYVYICSGYKTYCRIMEENNPPIEQKETSKEQKEMDLEMRKKCASFFFTAAQLVLGTFVLGSLAIFFQDWKFTWGLFTMFLVGIVIVVGLYIIATRFYQLSKK